MRTARKLGIKPLPQALAIAREAELDLVEVGPGKDDRPPVCRIMDYRRWQYEQQQRRKESRKKATNVVIKEMKYRPKIDIHDYTTKTKKVVQFLGEGHKVKVTIMFRGREMAHPELGRKILDQLAADVDRDRDGRVRAASGRPQHDDGAAPHEEAEAHEEATASAAPAATPRRRTGGTRRTGRAGGARTPTCDDRGRRSLRCRR